jgi:hypothetical protein
MLDSFSDCLSLCIWDNSWLICLTCSYPHALHHLELLQHTQFRSEMKKDEFFREYLHQKQFDHWRTWLVAVYIEYQHKLILPTCRRDPSHLNPVNPTAAPEVQAQNNTIYIAPPDPLPVN